MTRFFVIIILIFFSGIQLYGQSSARAGVSVTILEPVGTQKLQDLNFGTFKVGASSGSVELYSSRTRSSSGGVRLYETNEEASMATFKVINNQQAFSVTLPSEPLKLIRIGGTETMAVGSLSILGLDEKEVNGSNQPIAIGATLHAGASQPAGEYTITTPLRVNINYN
jgi:hypothetical protein